MKMPFFLSAEIVFLTDEQSVEGHSNAGHGHVRTEPFPDSCELPERSQDSGLVPIHQRGPQRSDVSASAYQQ